MSERLHALGVAAAAALSLAIPGSLAAQAPPPEMSNAQTEAAARPSLTFEAAVAQALERHPTVAEAMQAVRRAQALLRQARTVFLPALTGFVGETIIDEARGFDSSIVVPQKQASLSATISYSLIAPSRWAETRHAGDQVEIARISGEEARRQVAFTAAQSYLSVLTAQHQRAIAERNRDTARALADYARVRLEAGLGSRLNYVRASQELATAEGLVQTAELALTRSREALGVAVFAEGPVDASGEPEIAEPLPPTEDESQVLERPDLRVFSAQAEAADRVVRDNWTSWMPTVSASFTPQYVSPNGLFEKARTWRAFFQLRLPIFDGSLGATHKLLVAERESARLRLQAAETEARSEVRSAREAVSRNEQIAASTREAATNAVEALRITEVAYRAGANTNIEVVQAQQGARNAEILASLAADRLLQARLDLLVSLGQFP